MSASKKKVVRHYELISDVDVTLALATDLHGASGGEWLKMLEAEAPDAILCAGDIVECLNRQNVVDPTPVHQLLHRAMWTVNDWVGRHREDFYPHDGFDPERYRRMLENALSFLEGCGRIAPTFYSLGNHDWMPTGEERRLVRRTGVTMLDGAQAKLILPGGTLLIGGMQGDWQEDWLKQFAAQSGYKVLLCHRPELYGRMVKGRNVDLTVSGHAHGGQWRIGKMGVFAPGQGFFPKYAHGVYEERLAVSSGMTNTASLPRFGNPTEIVILRLRRKAESGRGE